MRKSCKAGRAAQRARSCAAKEGGVGSTRGSGYRHVSATTQQVAAKDLFDARCAMPAVKARTLRY